MQLGPRPNGSAGSDFPKKREETDVPSVEEMPVIEIGDEEIKPEDLPF